LDEFISPTTSPGNFTEKFDELNGEYRNMMTNNKEYPLENQTKKNNSTNYNIIQTKPFPVIENRVYNYTMNLEGENINSLSAIASFRNSSDVVVNSTGYGSNASNGNVLSLSPGSEVYTNLDILKPSNYTIALRVKSCETCTFLRMALHDVNDHIIGRSNISLKGSHNNSSSQLNWVYSNNTYLEPGKYELKLYSDSKTDLDSVLIYSANSDKYTYGDDSNSSIYKKHYDTVNDLFNSNDDPAPAKIVEYEKVNPTKHILKIENATKPFMISFAESYNKLWFAHTDYNQYDKNQKNTNDFKASSVPLYGVTNGFLVNKTGDYTLVIEYQPQKWFTSGAIISIFTLIAIIIILILLKRKIITKYCSSIAKRILKNYRQ
jgi:hypothetical protein